MQPWVAKLPAPTLVAVGSLPSDEVRDNLFERLTGHGHFGRVTAWESFSLCWNSAVAASGVHQLRPLLYNKQAVMLDSRQIALCGVRAVMVLSQSFVVR